LHADRLKKRLQSSRSGRLIGTILIFVFKPTYPCAFPSHVWHSYCDKNSFHCKVYSTHCWQFTVHTADSLQYTLL